MRDKFLSAAALAALLLSGGGVALADSILLKNGNVIEGKIISENDKEVTMLVRYGDDDSASEARIEMKFGRERIDKLTRDGDSSLLREGAKRISVTVSPVQEAEPAAAAGDSGSTAKAAASGPAMATLDEKLDPDLAKQIQAYIKDLGAEDSAVRDEAEKKLVAVGKDASYMIADVLKQGGNIAQRRGAARILGELGEKHAVRKLIDELAGEDNEDSRMDWAWLSLKKITGQTLSFSSRESTKEKRKEQQAAWSDWFSTVEKDYPYQFGYEKDGDRDAEQKVVTDTAAKAKTDAESGTAATTTATAKPSRHPKVTSNPSQPVVW